VVQLQAVRSHPLINAGEHGLQSVHYKLKVSCSALYAEEDIVSINVEASRVSYVLLNSSCKIGHIGVEETWS
jgi:hypothetical protein